MAYVSPEELRSNISGLTPDNQKAPDDFIARVIDQVSAHINCCLAHQYVVPVVMEDSPQAFNILKRIAIELSRPLIARKVSMKSSQVVKTQGIGSPLEMYGDILERIKDGSYTLCDAVPKGNQVLFSSGSYDTSEFENVYVPRRGRYPSVNYSC